MAALSCSENIPALPLDLARPRYVYLHSYTYSIIVTATNTSCGSTLTICRITRRAKNEVTVPQRRHDDKFPVVGLSPCRYRRQNVTDYRWPC